MEPLSLCGGSFAVALQLPTTLMEQFISGQSPSDSPHRKANLYSLAATPGLEAYSSIMKKSDKFNKGFFQSLSELKSKERSKKRNLAVIFQIVRRNARFSFY